jgi:hypothetical protein
VQLRGDAADIWDAVRHSFGTVTEPVRVLDCILALLALVAICGAPLLMF